MTAVGSAGPSAFQGDQKEASELHVLAGKGDFIKLNDVLSKHKKDLEKRDEDGFTPLLVAAYEGHEQAVKVLIKGGADVNATDPKHKRNALHIAAERKKITVIVALGAHKQLFKAKDEKGRTPEGLALVHKFNDIAALLQQEEKAKVEIAAKDIKDKDKEKADPKDKPGFWGRFDKFFSETFFDGPWNGHPDREASSRASNDGDAFRYSMRTLTNATIASDRINGP